MFLFNATFDDEKDDWFNREMRKKEAKKIILSETLKGVIVLKKNTKDNETGRGLNSGSSYGNDARDG